ncbi:MAG: hypothetical protein H8D56_06680 [Planctomycetes bacterium]|nr:hypothetical protein [Planctomycetota bacterium]MBL7143946.1 hypothetical protein [Phycisphaerae bacterium]
MLEILQDLEYALGGTVRLSPVVLVGPGLVCVVAGLFIWLGGLGFRQILVAVAGAITGGICGFFAIGQNIISAAFTAALAAALAMLFERIFITILTAALTAVLAFIVLARPYVENTQQETVISPGEIPSQDVALGVRESAEKMKTSIINAGQKVKHACLQMPVYNWAIIMVLILICIVAGFSLWQLASALCCSTLGTVLIFAGMILLLLNKGSMPVSIISSRSSFYVAVFAAMMAFGTTEQLLLCKEPKTSPTVKSQTGGNTQKPKQTRKRWWGT